MDCCNVCCETYKGRTTKVECIHCNYSSCNKCCKTYILSSINEAKCMSCHKFWNRDYLISNFTYSFVNKEYKKHLETLLFEREQSKFPDTQVVISRRREIVELREKMLDLHREITGKYDKIRDIENKYYDDSKDINVGCSCDNKIIFGGTKCDKCTFEKTSCPMCFSMCYKVTDQVYCSKCFCLFSDTTKEIFVK